MKIMLLFPSWTSEYGIAKWFGKKTATWQPLNLSLLAAIAEREGHEVRIIDGEAENMSLSKVVKETIAFNPDLIGLTGATPFYYMAVELARELKKADSRIPIAIGGAHITILRDKAFNRCFDYGFIGEADESFPEFLSGKNISEVKGILYRNNGNVRFTGEVEPIDDIDSLPVPARHLLKMDKYKIGTSQGTKHFTSIMFSRGCPFSCIFCSTGLFGKKVRRRSAKLIVDEMESVVKGYNIRHFVFADDNLTLDRKYMLEMCRLIKGKKLSITFEGGTRANLFDEELVKEMAEAGLIRVGFGLETVDTEMRKIIRKEVPLESYRVANKLASKYGIECLNPVIIGLPTETRKTINKTLAFLKESHEIKQSNSSIAMPYPGTELYNMAKRGDYGLKLLTEDYSKYIRYGSAVMQVGEFSPSDLVKLQQKAIVSIYSAYWRWIPLLRRGGVVGTFLTVCQLILNIISANLNRGKKNDALRPKSSGLKNKSNSIVLKDIK